MNRAFPLILLVVALLLGSGHVVSAQQTGTSLQDRVRGLIQSGMLAQAAANPTNAPAVVRENLARAIENYRTATELDPDLFVGHFYWGVCLAQLANTSTNAPEAQLLLYQARGRLALASHHPEATAEVFEQYGHLLLSTLVNLQPTAAGRKIVLEQADAVLRDGLKRARFTGDKARLQSQLGLCQVLLAVASDNKDYQRARYREAIELFTAANAVKSMETNAQMHGSWGIALLKLGQMTKDKMLMRSAAERFQAALDEEPKQTEYRYNLACVFAQLHQPELAMRHLSECLKDDPKGIFRATAQQDPDLASLRYTEEYKRVFGEGDPARDLGVPRISN